MKIKALSIYGFCLVLLFGCVSTQESSNKQASNQPKRNTLADLDLQPVRFAKSQLKPMTFTELSDVYSSLLNDIEDEQLLARLTERFAVLKMKHSEQEQINSKGLASYQKTIDELKNLLELRPNSTANELILYELAKLYDLDGQQQNSLEAIEQLMTLFPQSKYMLELQFRRAEALFSKREYAKAIDSYLYVVAITEANPYLNIAQYMQGWSYFKLEQHQKALHTFTLILDNLTPQEDLADVVTVEQFLQQVSPANKQMVNETFEIMTEVFANLSGAKAITQHYQRVGNRAYAHLSYDLLAQYYLDKRRYNDSYETYNAFIENNRLHHVLPFYALNKIEVLASASFRQKLNEEKLDFIKQFQPNSAYWSISSEYFKSIIAPEVYTLMQSFTQQAHHRAQSLKTAWEKNLALGESQRVVNEADEIYSAYVDASYWYQELLENFPEKDNVIELKYYLAESLFETGQLKKAITHYRDIAYNTNTQSTQTTAINNEYAAEAAFALILALDTLQESISIDAEKNKLTSQGIKAKTMFIEHFASDDRRLEVQHALYQEYFAQGLYQQTIELAQVTLTEEFQQKSAQNEPDIISALSLIGQSYLHQQQYANAEAAYQQLLPYILPTSARYQQIVDVLADSMYQQGHLLLVQAVEKEKLAKSTENESINSQTINAQQSEALNNEKQALIAEAKILRAQAIDHFSRIVTKTEIRTAAIRPNVAYELAKQYLLIQQWPDAISELENFSNVYPEHALAEDVDTKLAYALQQNKQWKKAADVLIRLGSKQDDNNQKESYLWLAAELYLKAGNQEKAIESYRDYAHNYTSFFDKAIEAMFILTEIYDQQKQPYKRNYWYKKIITTDKKQGKQATARSQYLAAMSTLALADERYESFKRVKLTLPLAKSLKRKRKLFDETVEAYNNTAKYAVAAFTTVANYRLGEVYRQLAKDLMTSQRPKELNELELEQYDILLEEQSFPFEEQAINVHAMNARRSYKGLYDQWVQASFRALADLQPGRYQKNEITVAEINDVH